MLGPRRYRCVVGLAIAVAVLLGGCDLLGGAAGEVTGRVVTAEGRPVQGATVLVDSMEYTSQVTATTGADGTYRARIASDAAASNFEVVAWFETEFNGGLWRLPLEPQGPSSTWGEDGLELDFVLRTQGEGHWTTYEPGHPSRYHGFPVEVEVYDQTLGDGFSQATELPVGATIDITFTPTGPLIDGSSVAPFTRRLTLEDATSSTNPFAGTIVDVPLGTYSVTAAVTSPWSVPLRVGSTCNASSAACPYPHDPPAASTELRVAPRSSHMAPFQSNPAAAVQLHAVP